MAPEAPRVATRASRAPRSPRGLLAVPWWSLTVLAILVVAATRAAADAEVYQEYARSARDEAAPAAAAPKWPEPDSEDEFVDRISMLMGPSKEGGRDLAAQRLRLSRLREEQEEKEREQQKQQQQQQQEDSLQKQLQGERASHESPQQQQQQVRPRPAQETKASAKAPQQQQQRPVDDTERQMQLYWQEAARAALAKQQKEAVSKAALARQQEAETKAAQEAAKARQAEAAKAALSKQQEVAAQQEEAKALYAKQQQEEARQAAAAAKAKQEEAVAAAKDEQQLEDLDDAYDIARALTQQPSVPAIDQTLLRTYMRSLGPQVGSVDQVGPIWQRYWDQVLASLSQQGLQQQQQPAVSDLIAELLNDAERQTQQTQQRQREMQWQAQQQQQTQDRQQQMLLQAQHEQMDPSTAQKMLLQQQQTQQQPQQQQQPPFTYTFQKPEQSSRFAINPADPRFWQEDPRLQYLVSRSGGVDGSQPQEDQYDEGSSGVRQALIRSASGLSIPMDLGVSSEQQPDQPDDMVDVDEDLGAVGDDMWLPQQRQQQQRQQQGARVTPPVVPEGIRHQPKPTATRDSRLDEESGRGSNLSNHDYPVVKKQLTFPKDHWFFGMDDVGKLAIFIGASIAVSSMILGFIVWQYRLHRNAKAAADVEYPAYGVTGPNKDVSPTGDRRLAQSAQMYHYQHQKQQILAMESRAAGGRRGSMSEAESEDENEEGDYTVYECPGLAPTQEMEVKNPLFQDDPTPATPAPGVGAEAGHDGDGLPEGGKQQQQQAGKTKQDKHSNNGKTTRSKPSDKSDRP